MIKQHVTALGRDSESCARPQQKIVLVHQQNMEGINLNMCVVFFSALWVAFRIHFVALHLAALFLFGGSCAPLWIRLATLCDVLWLSVAHWGSLGYPAECKTVKSETQTCKKDRRNTQSHIPQLEFAIIVSNA